MRIKILIILLSLFLIFIPGVLADIAIIKFVSNERVYTGQTLEINIKIINNGTETILGTLSDLPPEFAEITEGQKEMDPISMAYLQRVQLNLSSQKSLLMTYTINLSKVPEGFLNKNVKIGKAKFVDNEDKEYFSNEVIIFINTTQKIICNYNYKCEFEGGGGENHENCFQDCLSGLRDNYCDTLTDGRCDPDCSESLDKDCLSANKVLIQDNHSIYSFFFQKNYLILEIILIILVFAISFFLLTKFRKNSKF